MARFQKTFIFPIDVNDFIIPVVNLEPLSGQFGALWGHFRVLWVHFGVTLAQVGAKLTLS